MTNAQLNMIFETMNKAKKEVANPYYQRMYKECRTDIFNKFAYLVQEVLNKYPEKSEDLLQDGYIVLLKCIDNFNYNSSRRFKWYVIEKLGRLYDKKIFRNKKKETVDIDGDLYNSFGLYSNDFSDEINQKIVIDEMVSRLLPERYECIVKLSFGIGDNEKLSMHDIAKMVNVCETAAYLMRQKAYRRIKRCMHEDEK